MSALAATLIAGTTGVTGIPAAAAGPPVMTYLDVPADTISSEPTGINSAGTIIGNVRRGHHNYSGTEATMWDRDSGRTSLELLPCGDVSRAAAINRGGTIAGSATDVDHRLHAVRWDRAGRLTRLAEPPDAMHTTAEYLNDVGTVVGNVMYPDGSTEQLRWDRHGRYTVLTGPGSSHSSTAVNNAGLVIGTMLLGTEVAPVRWDRAGRLTRLGLLPEHRSASALFLNNSGIAAGGASTHDHRQQAVRWDRAGRITNLGAGFGTASTSVTGINNAGTVIGRVNAAGGPNESVRWDHTGHATLLDRLPGGDLGHPVAINNAGTIVGMAVVGDPDQVFHAVRWDAAGRIIDLGAGAEAFWINDAGTVIGATRTGWADEERMAVVWR